MEENQLPEPVPYNDAEYEGGVTVQIVPTHPFSPTTILWGLGKPETKPSNIRSFNNQPKPPAWSNPGGGMEEGEVERFLTKFPDHKMVLLANDQSLSLYDRNIICCGLREFIDETGYQDIEVYPYLPHYRYDRDNRDDNVSIYDFKYSTGHRVKTLFGHVTGFDIRDIVEKDEIAKACWFDMSIPLPKLFFDRVNFPLHPFFSHVRRLMITMHRVKRMSLFDTAPAYCRDWVDISNKIHPSWGLIFPVGAGYPGFPKNGFRFNRDNWYKLFYTMVSRRMEFADPDFIEGLFRVEIIEAKKREERAEDNYQVQHLNEYTTNFSTGRHDNLPVDELLKQDEEYKQWISDLKRAEDNEYAQWTIKPVA